MDHRALQLRDQETTVGLKPEDVEPIERGRPGARRPAVEFRRNDCHAFAEHLGLVLDRETLLRIVWGYDYLGDSRTIDVHVTWLRDKLERATVRIQTIRGIGYKLVATESTADVR